MVAPISPAGVTVQGKLKTVYAPTLSLTAPSLAIANGATALDVTNILYADSGRFNRETNTVTAPRRMGQRKTWSKRGTTNETYGNLRYVIDPQAATGSDGKKAYEKFVPGTVGFILERAGVDVDTDLAVGQFVRVIPVEFGDRNELQGDPNDEAAEFTVEQQVIVTAPGAGALVALVA